MQKGADAAGRKHVLRRAAAGAAVEVDKGANDNHSKPPTLRTNKKRTRFAKSCVTNDARLDASAVYCLSTIIREQKQLRSAMTGPGGRTFRSRLPTSNALWSGWCERQRAQMGRNIERSHRPCEQTNLRVKSRVSGEGGEGGALGGARSRWALKTPTQL